MKIVIFGATGKIGQELIPYIVRKDPQVDIFAVGHRKETVFDLPQIKYFSLDINEENEFEQLPENVDAVINMAAAVTTTVDSNNVRAYIQANIIGAVNILDYAVHAGADRIVYSQTYNDVFGNPETDIVIHPDTPRKERYKGEAAVYAITKNTAVDLQNYYQEKYGIKSFVLRLPTVHCPTQSPYYLVGGEKKLRPFRKMILQACAGEPIEIWGDPNHVMDMVYVQDCCQMFYLALKANVNGGTYNVGTGIGTSLQQQVEGMIEVFCPKEKKSEIVYRPEMPNGKSFIMDIENARNDLGYEPQYSYLDMLVDFKKRLLL